MEVIICETGGRNIWSKKKYNVLNNTEDIKYYFGVKGLIV